MKKNTYIHVYLIQKYIKDILKCPVGGLIFIMKQFCGILSAHNTAYKHKWWWKLKSFPGAVLLLGHSMPT